jgi:hypothetical protein
MSSQIDRPELETERPSGAIRESDGRSFAAFGVLRSPRVFITYDSSASWTETKLGGLAEWLRRLNYNDATRRPGSDLFVIGFPSSRSERTIGIRRLRGFLRKLVNLGLRRAGSADQISRAFEEFRAASLSWAQDHLAGRPEELFRVESLANAILERTRLRHCEGDLRFRPFLAYVLARLKHSRSTRACLDGQREFGGLVLSLAASFKGSTEWLGEDQTIRSLLLLSMVYEALRSSTIALFGHSRCELSNVECEIGPHLRERVLQSQLKEYGLSIKRCALGDLEGCLIRTEFGSSIYVNDKLPAKRQEWVCLHELGHFLLRHRANSEYGLDISNIACTETMDLFVRQECEADSFAELWRHVLSGLLRQAID